MILLASKLDPDMRTRPSRLAGISESAIAVGLRNLVTLIDCNFPDVYVYTRALRTF